MKAISINPFYGEAFNCLGTSYHTKGDLKKATKYLLKAIQLLPKSFEPYHNIGNVYFALKNYESCIKSYKKALSINLNSNSTLLNLGIVLQEKEEINKAISCFKRVVKKDAFNSKAHCHLYHSYLKMCDWKSAKIHKEKVEMLTSHDVSLEKKPDEMPFLNLIRLQNPEMNYKVAKLWSNEIKCIGSEKFAIYSKQKNMKGKKITIGYISNNFKNHPTSHLIWKIFELHDSKKFLINVYSYGEDDKSIYRNKISESCDKFIDIKSSSHYEAAKIIAEDKVDILVDLVGYMTGHRLEIAAHRPAPVQVRWLGLAGSTGANFFDYIITDKIVTPPEEKQFYSERFVYMPHCYQINSEPLVISDQPYTRSDFQLPEDKFVYCCFCSNYKIDSHVFGVWMEILNEVPEGVLWIMNSNSTAKTNMKNLADLHGIKQERIIFSKKTLKHIHLERLKLADLALDTFTINGAATTSDALWAGVPVITKKGGHFASRMAASILGAIGLDNLVFDTEDEYRNKAINLGNNPSVVKLIKERLKLNSIQQPLFDTKRFVQNLEKTYLELWEYHICEKNSDIIWVEDVSEK